MKNQFSIFKSTLFALALSAVLVSCDKDDDPETGNVLVTHASPNAPGVDLLVDNVKVNTVALTFPNNTGYLNVNAGVRNVKVNVAGSATTVINADLTIEKDKNYSVFATNLVASLAAIAVEDNLSAPATGKAHVRFFHLSPGAPAVTVGTLVGSTFTAIAPFTNRAFETQATATANAGFTPVDAGTYNFDVRVAGTTTSVLNLPGIVLQAGKIYTVFARGIVGNTTTPLGASIIPNN
jgi:hypothetical protein